MHKVSNTPDLQKWIFFPNLALMEVKDGFITKIRQVKEEFTLPAAFNLLNRGIKDRPLDERQARAYRIELGNIVWEYLTGDLPYEFSPAVYQAMRKILRSEMLQLMSLGLEDPFLSDRANFFLALTAEGTRSAKDYLSRIRKEQEDQDFENACLLLARMVEAHEEACGED